MKQKSKPLERKKAAGGGKDLKDSRGWMRWENTKDNSSLLMFFASSLVVLVAEEIPI